MVLRVASAGQTEIIIQMEKLVHREWTDMPKVTHPELEAGLEPGYEALTR